MTDLPSPDPRPDVERGPQPASSPPDSLPPGGLPAGPQGDEADPGTGRLFEGVGEDTGALDTVADELDARVRAGV